MLDFNIIPKKFYDRDTQKVAKDLLGKYLVRKIDDKYLVGMISETEAYTEDDPASHCYNGLTERNKSMFGPVGHAYVYISYGIHHCFNIVSRAANKHLAGGTLIRAVVPIHGLDTINNNRNNKTLGLTNGPGKLTEAFLINKSHDGLDLTNKDSEFFIAYGQEINKDQIIATPRIGISKAKDKLWRFILNETNSKLTN